MSDNRLTHREISGRFIDSLNLKNRPIAIYGAEEKPPDSLTYEDGDYRCIVPRIHTIGLGGVFAVESGECLCPGGDRYLGYLKGVSEGFEYFLSTGHPEVRDGRCERFKESPEIVREMLEEEEKIEPLGKVTVFEALDEVSEDINPEILVFFCEPDKISALLFLVGFPTPDNYIVQAPFSSGCGSILVEPMKLSPQEPGAILGCFDLAARPFIPKEILSIAVRYEYARVLAEKIPESFLTIEPWLSLKER